MGELTSIGFNPGQSLLHRLDPRTKQSLMLGLSLVSVWGDIYFLSILTIALAFLFRSARLKVFRLIREIRYFLFLVLFIFIVRSVTLDSGWVPVVSTAAAKDGMLVCWRLMAVVLMGILLMATTRIAHIRAALVFFLKPVPFVDEKMTATMVGLVVRFLPVILAQAAEICDAQRARGIEMRKNPLARLVKFSIPLFRRVFWGADELSVAMQARCYNEDRALLELSFGRLDGWAMGSGVLLCLTVLIP
jgi:energy-coupling factor transporter transmembrane protein EcfT